jgi:hypothetical protein
VLTLLSGVDRWGCPFTVPLVIACPVTRPHSSKKVPCIDESVPCWKSGVPARPCYNERRQLDRMNGLPNLTNLQA